MSVLRVFSHVPLSTLRAVIRSALNIEMISYKLVLLTPPCPWQRTACNGVSWSRVGLGAYAGFYPHSGGVKKESKA